MRAGKIRTQSFSRLQLMRLDQGAAIASAPARQPDKRAFRFIDDNAGAAEVGDDLALRQSKMLRAKAVNDRLRSLRLPACSLSPLGAFGLSLAALRSRRLEVGVSAMGDVLYRIIYLQAAPRQNEDPLCRQAKISTAFRNLSGTTGGIRRCATHFISHAAGVAAPVPFVWRVAIGRPRSLAPPWGSRRPDPIFRDTARASCCTAYANGA